MAWAIRHTRRAVGEGLERGYRFRGWNVRQLLEEPHMAVEDRIRSLRDKHAQLDQEIIRESARSLPDAARVAECKRAKLRIKDTIVDLERSH